MLVTLAARGLVMADRDPLRVAIEALCAEMDRGELPPVVDPGELGIPTGLAEEAGALFDAREALLQAVKNGAPMEVVEQLLDQVIDTAQRWDIHG